MAKTLFYTLFLSGFDAEQAYNKCVEQNTFTEEELNELQIMIENGNFI